LRKEQSFARGTAGDIGNARRAASERRAAAVPKPAFFYTPANLGAMPLMVPLAGESVDAFKARVTPDAVKQAAQDGTLGVSELGWAGLLAAGIVPDDAFGDFLAIAHEVQKDGRQLDVLQSDAVSSFAEKLQSLHESKGPAHVSETLKAVRARLERPGADFAAVLGQQEPFLTAQQQKRLESRPAPATTLASHLKSLFASPAGADDAMDIDADMHMGLFGPRSDKVVANQNAITFATYAQHLPYSWAKHEEYAKTSIGGDSVMRALYGLILNAPFNYQVCRQLATIGCELLRFVYARPFPQFTADSVIVMRAGPTTMMTGAGHFQVVSGLDDKQNAVTAHAEFKVGVINVDPKGLRMIPAAICHDYHGGRTVDFVRSRAELLAPVQSKPSILALPIPVTERKHSVPLSLTGDAAFAAPDTAELDPYQKTSATELFTMFAGEEVLGDLTNFDDESYHGMVPMATHLNRALASYYNAQNGKWEIQPGTGPLGDIGRNTPGAAAAYLKQGTFDTNYESIGTVVH
jgi:hypothetical protein